MKISQAAKQLAKDLDLDFADAYIMQLKATLYQRCSKLIKASPLTHSEIAEKIGTSRSRINRIAHLAENNISIELLIKLSIVLEGKPVFELVA